MRYFCYWINTDIFPGIGAYHLREIIFGGMRFDLTAVLYLSSLYIICMLFPFPSYWRENPGWQKLMTMLLFIPNAAGIIVNCIDIAYIRYSDRRTTCTFFTEFANENNIWQILGHGIIDYWYIALFGLAVLVIFYVCIRKEFWSEVVPARIYYPVEAAILAGTIFFCVIGIRGGFGRYTRPITISNAMQYANHPRETALILNTPFCLMKTIENTVYEEPAYFESGELEEVMTPIHPEQVRTEQSRNVVIIILESFSKEYIGFYNPGHETYTPFLDELLAHSETYAYSFASGRKSIDAMPSVLSSIPMLIEPYIVTPYATNDISSIADCLKNKGYYTAFFHGAPNGSMGFQAFARSAEFDKYYGMDEFGDKSEYDGTWAIWDEPFLQFYANTMNTMQEPFLTAVFTASSHHPFKVPDQYRYSFPEGKLAIHPTIGYADFALKRFFDTASKQPWYKNTLFVITADHTNELFRPEYANAKGIFEVPIAIFDPQVQEGAFIHRGAVSQTDIMPTVLNRLGYDKAYFAFGEEMGHKQHPYAVCYNEPYYQIFSDRYLLQFDGERVVAVYDYRHDPCLRTNIATSVAPEQIEPMLMYLKAYIQQYIHRMVHNELTIH